MILKKYHCIKQQDHSDCAAACLATVCKQYGLKIPITKIRELAGTDQKGTNIYGILKAADRLGFTAKAVKGNREGFFSSFPLPCIAHVIVNKSLQHFVVIHKITKTQVVIADPMEGIVKLTPEQFFGMNNDSVGYKWNGIFILFAPNINFKKGDLTIGACKRCYQLCVPLKKPIFRTFFLSLLYTFLILISALGFKTILGNNTYFNKNLSIMFITFIVLLIFQTFLNCFRSYLLINLRNEIDISLLWSYWKHILSLPLNFFHTRRVEEIMSRFDDVQKVRDNISKVFITIMTDLPIVIFGGAIISNENQYMLGISLLTMVVYFIITWGLNSWCGIINRKQVKYNAQLAAHIEESIIGNETMKQYNAVTKMITLAKKKMIQYIKDIFSFRGVMCIRDSLQRFLVIAGIAVVIWSGIINVMNTNMTMDQFILFSFLMIYFLESVKNLGNLSETVQSAALSVNRLGEVLDLEPELKDDASDKIDFTSTISSIEMSNISFRYGTLPLALENVTFKIEQGETVAFVGESGSGKTSIAKLLLHLYTPEKGEITINHVDLKNIQVRAIRDRIAYVSHDPFFIKGTIMENLTFGLDEIDPAQVIRASKITQIHDFINSLPQKYETKMEEYGTNFSRGQKQKLAITRAILKTPDVLFLDEATDNIDAINEYAIEQGLQAYHNMTTFIITHRISTLERCDRIYVMDKGKIVEVGTHKELFELKGQYYRLFYSKFL